MPAMAPLELCDGGAQGRANVAERGVDSARERAHTSGCAERDQSDDQSVFNQVLTFFTVLQILELDVEIEKHRVHVFLPEVFVKTQAEQGTLLSASDVPISVTKAVPYK